LAENFYEPISYLAPDAKIDPFPLESKQRFVPVFQSVPVGTAGKLGRIDAGMGGFGMGWRYEMGSKCGATP